MNKSEFIKSLFEKTGYSEEKCSLINDIVEDTFIIGKKGKDQMIEKFKCQINLNDNEANELYETIMSIVANGIKNKIKHPFKSQD